MTSQWEDSSSERNVHSILVERLAEEWRLGAEDDGPRRDVLRRQVLFSAALLVGYAPDAMDVHAIQSIRQTTFQIQANDTADKWALGWRTLLAILDPEASVGAPLEQLTLKLAASDWLERDWALEFASFIPQFLDQETCIPILLGNMASAMSCEPQCRALLWLMVGDVPQLNALLKQYRPTRIGTEFSVDLEPLEEWQWETSTDCFASERERLWAQLYARVFELMV